MGIIDLFSLTSFKNPQQQQKQPSSDVLQKEIPGIKESSWYGAKELPLHSWKEIDVHQVGSAETLGN